MTIRHGKPLKHSCGAVESFIDNFVKAGFDILNPVQCSATGMDPRHLKDAYGDRLTFWGGGIDTQKTLPFDSPAQVKAEALERLAIFSKNGGFVFSSIHNVQAKTPLANMIALLDAVKEFNATGDNCASRFLWQRGKIFRAGIIGCSGFPPLQLKMCVLPVFICCFGRQTTFSQ